MIGTKVTWVNEKFADVYVNVVKQFKKDYQNLHLEITHIVGIQPDHPDRQTTTDELINYLVIINKYDDLVI